MRDGNGTFAGTNTVKASATSAAELGALLDGARRTGPGLLTETLTVVALSISTVAIFRAATLRAVRRAPNASAIALASDASSASAAVVLALLRAVDSTKFGKALAAIDGALSAVIAIIGTLRGRNFAVIAEPALRAEADTITALSLAVGAVAWTVAFRAVLFGVSSITETLVLDALAVHADWASG